MKFIPQGVRDVYWCCALDMPFVLTDKHNLGPDPVFEPNKKIVCPYCRLEFEMDSGSHTFIVSIEEIDSHRAHDSKVGHPWRRRFRQEPTPKIIRKPRRRLSLALSKALLVSRGFLALRRNPEAQA